MMITVSLTLIPASPRAVAPKSRGYRGAQALDLYSFVIILCWYIHFLSGGYLNPLTEWVDLILLYIPTTSVSIIHTNY